MSEMSTVLGFSFADWQSYLLWVEEGRPDNWIDRRRFHSIDQDQRVKARLIKKWGTEH